MIAGRNILILLLVVSSFGVNAQGLFRYFNWTAYSDGAERIDHVVLDVNVARFQQVPLGIQQGYFNIGVNAYLFHDHPINKKGSLAWAIGVGYSGMNIHHNAKISYAADVNGDLITELTPFPSDLSYRKNKINLNYVEVPFELRIRSMKESEEDRKTARFKLYLGFKAGYLVNSHTKFIDDESKIKVYNIKNTLPYRYGPTIRVGFKKIAFHAFYSLTSVFETGKGPELYPFSVGLTWMRL